MVQYLQETIGWIIFIDSERIFNERRESSFLKATNGNVLHQCFERNKTKRFDKYRGYYGEIHFWHMRHNKIPRSLSIQNNLTDIFIRQRFKFSLIVSAPYYMPTYIFTKYLMNHCFSYTIHKYFYSFFFFESSDKNYIERIIFCIYLFHGSDKREVSL